MNKYQALDGFYKSFSIPAYEENSVPKTAQMPYITYEVITNNFSEFSTALSCQIWYKSNSWKEINAKTEELAQALSAGVRLECDKGYIMLYSGSPFAQSRTDATDGTVKCKYINITADYITL